MELGKLYYFYVTAKYQHVTRAAEQLHIAQPALTKSIKLLERDLGVPLFYKDKRNVRLTPFGLHLKDRLEGVFDVLEQLPQELEELKESAGRTVRLNVLAASGVVTAAIVSYKKQREDVIFQVIQNEEEMDCDVSVTTNAVDFARLPAFSERAIIEEKIYLAVPKNAPYGREGRIDLREVQDKGFVGLAGSRLFRVICDKLCFSAGFRPKIIFESDSPVAVKNLIGAGAGIGFWPAFSWGRITPDIRLLSIRHQPCQRELIIGLHQNGSLSDAAEDFYRFLISFMQEQKQKTR